MPASMTRKPVITITVHDQAASTIAPSVFSQDVSFARFSRISRIAFRNNYAAFIAIRGTRDRDALHRKDRDSLEGWVAVLPKAKLMNDPHCEDTAQHWHSFGPDDFTATLDDIAFIALRLYYYQPSPTWSNFGVRHIKVWGDPPDASTAAMPVDRTSAALLSQLAKSKSITANIEQVAASLVDLKRWILAAVGIVIDD